MKKIITLGLSVMMAGAMTMGVSAEEKVDLNVIAAQYGQNTADWWAKFVEDFNAANPGINLNVEVVSWNDIYTVVNTRIGNGQAPDILNIDVFADYQADDLLLPAKDYVSEETYAKMYESFLAQSEIDGTVWAVPDLASARAMYYNADILEAAGVEVPTTWDELIAACEAIKAYDDSIYPWGIDMTTDEGQAAFAYSTWNNGGGFVDENGDWALNTPENVEAVEYAIGLVNSGYTNSDPANDTRYDLQDM
ncbi:MAG: extracellular solute-binding protein, partial [Lachnospiraceae bacterium]|nr:extracellular solute-binding protein [Lachnospiraceae bacterium]